MDPTTAPFDPTTSPAPTVQSPLGGNPLQTTPTENGSKKKIIILGSFLLLVIIAVIGIVIYFFFKRPTPTPVAIAPTPTPKVVVQQQQASQMPIAKFKSYTLPTTAPEAPTPLYEYTLKSNFTDSEALVIARKFNLKNSERKGDELLFKETTDPGTRGQLTFNSKTGNFSFQNHNKTMKVTGDIKTGAKEFLTSIGLSDEAVECNITYKIVDSDATYVECHRSWEKLGIPLVSVAGLVNLSPSTKIKNMRVGYVPTEAISDPSIINVSTGQNGKVRPNDINTATFIIQDDGTIVSIDSTMRFISTKTEVYPSPYEDALLAFSDNKEVASYIFPAGYGTVDTSKIFPQNVAESLQAKVDDFEIVYLENPDPSKQTAYKPVYLLRGSAQLTNGYTVNYIQSAPGSSSTEPITANLITTATTVKPLKIGTFTPEEITPTPTSTDTPETPTTTTAPEEPLNADCRYGASFPYSFDYTYALPNGGSITLTNPGPGAKNTLYVKSASGPDTKINTLRKEFLKLVENQYVYNYAVGPHRQDPAFRTVSSFGGLAGFYQNVTLQESDNYLPKGKYYPLTQTSPLMKEFFTSLERRVMAIDAGGGAGADPGLHFWPLYNVLISIHQLGSGKDAASRCYLSGGSPAIFLYSNSNQPYTVSVTPNLTYADPKFTDSWKVTTNPQGIITTNDKLTRIFLYYEFDRTAAGLTHGEYGYSAERKNVGNIADQISKQLKLTTSETTQLENEFNSALVDVPAQYSMLKITLVNEKELNEKLPLIIKPAIPTRRYHFLISGSNADEYMVAPRLAPIKRTSELMVEIGASGK